jgi:hypothetical protein
MPFVAIYLRKAEKCEGLAAEASGDPQRQSRYQAEAKLWRGFAEDATEAQRLHTQSR